MADGQDGSWVVLKFSGTSICTPSKICDVVKARRAAGARVLLICETSGEALAEALRGTGHDVAWVDEPFAAGTDLEQRLARLAPLVVVQGTDLAAANLAAALRAERLEIWTDVPGMFSANPQTTPAARLLRALHYDEAQEIAGSGAQALHPRSILPVRQCQIPVHFYAAQRPELQGTVISGASVDGAAKVKAVCIKKAITLISMDSPGMWHEVGFLAGAFGVFKAHGISVDLVSTSETNVTVSLDPAANGLGEDRLAALVADLSGSCRVQLIGPCASVSLVGRNIRAILHQLGEAFELFEEQKIYLVSQAANDLNFTFVVDEEQGDRLVAQLHELLIRPGAGDRVLGPTWEQLFAKPTQAAERSRQWWHRKRAALIAALGPRDAAFVYDRESVVATARRLRGMKSLARVLYAMKANPHPELLALAHREGLDMECVSRGELERVLEVLPSIERQRVLFTPNFAPRAEYEWAYTQDVRVTLDNLYALEAWPEVFAGREAFVRIDTGAGRGHHQHVRTAGAHSKFGIPVAELAELARDARAAQVRIVGLHAHLGSGIFDVATWAETAELLGALTRQFPDARVIDVGGGLGVAEHSGQPGLDLSALDAALMRVKARHAGIDFWIEPGRFVIANAGVLLARVTQTKSKGEVNYVGVATGMNSLIRPALYGAYHEIVNLTRLHEPATELVNVVGPICESGDILGHDRLLPPTREGDVLLIGSAGAYARAMASSYNLRAPAEELWI